MRTTLRSLVHAAATVAMSLAVALFFGAVTAQTVLDTPELYGG